MGWKTRFVTIFALSVHINATIQALPMPSPPGFDALSHAIALGKEDRFEEALGSFREFVSQYPEHPYADQAHYWIAYCHYRRGEFRLVIATTDFLLAEFPTTFRRADAQLLGALSKWRIEPNSKSSEGLRELIARYPNSPVIPFAEKDFFGQFKKP